MGNRLNQESFFLLEMRNCSQLKVLKGMEMWVELGMNGKGRKRYELYQGITRGIVRYGISFLFGDQRALLLLKGEERLEWVAVRGH